jgi:hypothetical protein
MPLDNLPEMINEYMKLLQNFVHVKSSQSFWVRYDAVCTVIETVKYTLVHQAEVVISYSDSFLKVLTNIKILRTY